MKKSSLIFLKDKIKKLKCHLLQFLFGTLRVEMTGTSCVLPFLEGEQLL